MPTLRDIRELRSALEQNAFRTRLGAFVLIRRLPEPLEMQALTKLANRTTQVLTAGDRLAGAIALLLQFEDVEVFGAPGAAAGATVRLGRLEGNEVVLNDPSVSKRHAELRWAGSRCVLRDAGSSNGTWVNRKPAKASVELSDGDELHFGHVRMLFASTAALWRALPGNAPAKPQTSVPAASARREVVRLPESYSPGVRGATRAAPGGPPPRTVRTYTPPPGLPVARSAPPSPPPPTPEVIDPSEEPTGVHRPARTSRPRRRPK